MEILRHGNSLQSDLGEMSAWPGFQASYQAGAGQDQEEREKYFYQNNEFFKTNEGDKAIREILHLLEEKLSTRLQSASVLRFDAWRWVLYFYTIITKLLYIQGILTRFCIINM